MFTIRKGLVILVCVLQASGILAQGYSRRSMDTTVRKLLYVLDGTTNYMVPYIEQKLKNLRYAESDRKLFDSVDNLNSLTQTVSIQSIIIQNLIDGRLLKVVNATAGHPADSIQRYKDFLNRYNSVVVIKINTFSELIEFQFTLFSTRWGDGLLQYVTSMS